MCRIFALRASRATRVRGSLVESPTALRQQSCRDSRGECHRDGWGIGYYVGAEPRRERHVGAAPEDPRYTSTANALIANTVLAHVRQSSMGAVSPANCHPFLYKHWLFAHNGTLFGFPAARERIRAMIAGHLVPYIEGETDSVHIFFVLLSRLEQAGVSWDDPADAGLVSRVLRETLCDLRELCPMNDKGQASQLNCVLTDGQAMVASRWGYTLFRLERRGSDTDGVDKPLDPHASYHAIALASEPTTDEKWEEIPDRTIVCIGSDFGCTMQPI